MSKHDTTAKIVDEILRYSIGTAVLITGVTLPGLMIGLDKPLDIFLKHLDKRERQREVRRILKYMKAKGLLCGEYEHGLQLTDKARKRLQRILLDDIKIAPTDTWSRKWYIVFYDIPEEKKHARNAFCAQLRQAGFILLQRSTLISPFPCRSEVATIAAHYEVDTFITYIEATYIDNAAPLIKRFQHKFPQTKF
jgi:DNA-binding transcriptional regulator PaaX